MLSILELNKEITFYLMLEVICIAGSLCSIFSPFQSLGLDNSACVGPYL